MGLVFPNGRPAKAPTAGKAAGECNNSHRDIVIPEENYLLLNWEGWCDLKKYADYTTTLTADEDLLRSRLISRKISTGVSPEEAEKFVDYSDMYNVRTCLRDTMEADLTIRVGRGKK